MEQPDLVLLEHRGPVATLTLNRPAARNSLSLALLHRLHDRIVSLGADRETHVIVIAAKGPAFCAGHDLKELTAARAGSDGGQAFFAETMQLCARLMLAITACPKPVIASVQGMATAAGCQLVATCDLAVASETARFATPGVNIGLFCSTPMVALTRTVPRKQAMKMLLTGEAIPAAEAQDIGLVNDVVPEEELAEATQALARRIAEKAPATLRIGKEAFHAQSGMPLEEAYAYTAGVMVRNMMQPDAEEGIAAFVGKRPPEWQPL